MVIVGYFDPVFFPILDIDLLYFLTNLLLYYIIFYLRVYLVIHYKFINNLLYFCSGEKFLSVGLSIFFFVFFVFFFSNFSFPVLLGRGEALIIFYPILLPIKLPVAPAVF